MRLKFKTEEDAKAAYELIVTSGLFAHEFLDGCEIVCEGGGYDADCSYATNGEGYEIVFDSTLSPLRLKLVFISRLQ